MPATSTTTSRFTGRLAVVLRAAVLLAVLLPCPLVLGEDAPAPDIRAKVAQWLQDLQADDFETRETARTQLKVHGAKARDLLEAARDHEDPEVRRTVRAILARAGSRPRTTMPAQVQDGRLDEMHLVDLDVAGVTLEAALEELGRRIGAHFKVPPSVREKKVTIRAKARPPFAVLRELLALGTLRMATPFDRNGLGRLVLADDAPVPPWTASGPVLVEVMEVTASRALNATRPPRHTLSLRVQWIPLIQVAQYEMPKLVKAEDSEGNAFVAGTLMARRASYGVGMTRRYADVQVHLTPSSEKCGNELASLEIHLPIASLHHDRRSVVLRDLERIPICLDRAGKEADPGTAETVAFESLKKSDDGRGQWVADLSATLASEVGQRTVQAALEHPDGRFHALYVAGGRSRAEDGTVRLTARAYSGGGPETPNSLHVSWFHRQDAGSLAIKLTKVPLR